MVVQSLWLILWHALCLSSPLRSSGNRCHSSPHDRTAVNTFYLHLAAHTPWTKESSPPWCCQSPPETGSSSLPVQPWLGQCLLQSLLGQAVARFSLGYTLACFLHYFSFFMFSLLPPYYTPFSLLPCPRNIFFLLPGLMVNTEDG